VVPYWIARHLVLDTLDPIFEPAVVQNCGEFAICLDDLGSKRTYFGAFVVCGISALIGARAVPVERLPSGARSYVFGLGASALLALALYAVRLPPLGWWAYLAAVPWIVVYALTRRTSSGSAA
jgi:hypothetical protein